MSHAQLTDRARTAYHLRDFVTAAKLFQECVDLDSNDWHARLYLGMAYYQTGETFLTIAQFRFLVSNSPDKEIFSKAELALQAIRRDVDLLARINKRVAMEALKATDEDDLELFLEGC